MSKGTLNKVMIIGNLGADPRSNSTLSGNTVVNLSVATTQMRRSGDEKEEITEWHRVVLYGKQAELAEEYLSKGRKVYIEGRLQTRKWTDKNEMVRYTTEIVGNSILFLSTRSQEHIISNDQEPSNPDDATLPKDSVLLDNIDILDGELPF